VPGETGGRRRWVFLPLLTRIRFERLKLPVLTHVLATINAAGLSLAVTDLDHWLETRVSATIDPFTPQRFLIPAQALKAAKQGDKKSSAHFAVATTPDDTTLALTVSCGNYCVLMPCRGVAVLRRMPRASRRPSSSGS